LALSSLPAKLFSTMQPKSNKKQRTFGVRVYEPVVTEWKTELRVPAASQKEANEIVAAIKKAGEPFPPEWIVKEYLVDGTEPLPDIHGQEFWSVSDQEGEMEDLNINADTSRQRAFVWSADYRNIAHITRADTPCIPHIGHGRFGILIAEKVSEPSIASNVWMPGLDAKDLSGGITGQHFFCPQDKVTYRVLWVFTNPQ
jgi:hypothetical protein